jgi:hypothetical protein
MFVRVSEAEFLTLSEDISQFSLVFYPDIKRLCLKRDLVFYQIGVETSQSGFSRLLDLFISFLDGESGILFDAYGILQDMEANKKDA